MSEKILIVDDDELDREIIRRQLYAAGYKDILMASNSDEAVEKVEYERPDLVILDMLMPGKIGLRTCYDIKKILGAKVKIIISTGALGNAINTDDVRACGADEYVEKSSEGDRLILAVKKVFNH